MHAPAGPSVAPQRSAEPGTPVVLQSMEAARTEGQHLEEQAKQAGAAAKQKQDVLSKLQKEFAARKQQCAPPAPQSLRAC